MSRRTSGSKAKASPGTALYIADMMAELARLSQENGDSIGAILISECADALRRRNSLNAVLGAMRTNLDLAPSPIIVASSTDTR